MSHENVRPQVIRELLSQLHRQQPINLLNSCGPSALHDDVLIGRSPDDLKPNWLKERRVSLPNGGQDPTEIHAVIRGPDESPYARGFFTVKLFIEAGFPRAPPRVVFGTRVFHPNVCELTGDVCTLALRRKWCPERWSLERFIDSVVELVEQPSMDKPLNMTAARLYSADRDGYDRRARLCTVMHALPRPLTPVKRRRASSSGTASEYGGFGGYPASVDDISLDDFAEDGLIDLAAIAGVKYPADFPLSFVPPGDAPESECSEASGPSTPCAMSIDGCSEKSESPRRRVPLEIEIDSSSDESDGELIAYNEEVMVTPRKSERRCSPLSEARSAGSRSRLAGTPKGGLFGKDASPVTSASVRVRSLRHCTTPHSPFLGTPVRSKRGPSSLRRL